MKRLALLFLSIGLLFNSYAQNYQESRAFEPNLGQYNNRNWQSNEVKFAVNDNPFYIFFTEKGLTYRFDKIIKNPRHVKGDYSTPKRINISELVHATWVGANPDVEIVAENKTEHYFSHSVRIPGSQDVQNIGGVPGYQKIIYKNLYDNIDVEYVIHPEGGVKYSIILHPGADPSQIQLQYKSSSTEVMDEGITMQLNAEGQLVHKTSLGDVVEEKPFTFYDGSEHEEVSSAYRFENGILSFDLGQYDQNRTLIIDPWVLSPNYNTSTAVWEVETDGTGNVYCIGGETPMELRKFDLLGGAIWTYVTPWDTNSVWLGTLATDAGGTSYITSGTSPEIERIDNAGNMIWHNNGGGLFSSTEYWSITFNCDKTKLIVGGTDGAVLDFQATIFDIDINNGNVLNSVEVGNQGGFTPVEVRSISSSKNAKYIYLTHNEVGAINQNIGACPTDLPVFEENNQHNLGYKCENYLPETQNGGGLKALVANDNYFYTHAGDEIFQRDLNTGALITSVPLPGGSSQTALGDLVVHCSGLAVDNCGNVYAGSDDRVVMFDENLNFISETIVNFSVYDVSVNSNGEVIAVGAQQDNGATNRNGRIQSVNFGACPQYALVCCDANICPPDTLCENDPSINLVTTTAGGTFSGTGITNPVTGEFDPATAGAGTYTVTYTLACGTDEQTIVVDPCTSLDACVEANGDITITNGDGNNTWEEWTTITTTSNDCVECGGTVVFGFCTVSLPCSISSTGYSVFATGTSTETPTPNFPIQVTDGLGSSIIINDISDLNACSATCDATISAAGPFCEDDAAVTLSAVDPGGTWSGTGITNGSTGTFDPATAGAGTHTITYTLACGDSDTENITVNALDDPSFSYASGSFCLSDPNPSPTITGVGGGTFTIDNGGSINASTGVINLSASGAGSYVVTYTTNGACPNSTTFNITITNGADATITAAGPFCETDAAVNLTAVDAGGTWSGTGITNGATGAFDPATAGAGTHTITYTIAGGCGDSDTEDITVNAVDDPTFSYASGSFCLSDPDPVPDVIVTAGGTFTIDNGGVINPSTGSIDIAGSGAGSYTVTYTTAGPCPDNTTFNITITNGADATITAAGPFCETDAAVNLTAVDAGGTWSGTGITNGATGTFDPATAGAGTHTITYTISGGCGDSDTEDITVNAVDDPSFSYASGSFCLSDPNPSPTITGTAGGTFTIDNGGVINPATGEIDIAGSGAGSYTITYTTAGPCPDNTTFAVTLTNGADATITAAGPFCETDAAVNLTAVDAGGTWSGTGITNGATGTFDPATAGAGTHTITYTIAGGCGDSDTEDITVNAVDDPSFSYASGSFCLSDPNPSPTITGTAGGTFTIDNGGVINPATGEIDIASSGAGSYTVTYTTSGLCPDNTTFAVTLTNGADATITAAGPFCETDAAVNLTAVDAGGTWSGTGITNGATGAFDPATAGAGTHTITYTIAGGCGDSDTEDITVNAVDDPTFSYASGSFCLSDPDPVPDVIVTAGGTFTIDNGGVINPSTGSIDIAGSGAGSYTVTYTTAGPCPDNTTFNITITNGADATITAAGPFCETDAAINLSAVDAGGTWSGTGITNGATGTFDPATAGAGTHTITYTISGGCGDSDTEDITVNAVDDPSFSYASGSFCLSDPNPSPTITGTAGGTFTIDNGGSINPTTGVINLAASGTGNFTVTYTTAGPCPDNTTFAISITTTSDATISAAGPFCENDPSVNLTAATGGGTWSGTGITDAVNGTFDPATAGAGTHTITYTIAGACGATETETITVNAADIAAFSYPQNTYCENESDPFPSLMGTLGGTFTMNNGGSINPATGWIDLAASGPGVFTVTYTTSGVCPDAATFNITIVQAADASILQAGPYCIGDPADSLIAVNGGGTWSGTGITDPVNGWFTPDSSGIGSFEIIYEIAGQCGDSDTIMVDVFGLPNAGVTADETINIGNETTIEATGGSSYYWYPNYNIECNDCAETDVYPLESTDYCVVVTDTNSCVDTACVRITVDMNCADIFVPNAFSPNGDNSNNLECVYGGCITEMHFMIYDRWGELVFESKDQNVCWDGTYRGKDMNTGVYVYKLEATLLTGEEVSLSGNITLVR